MSDIFIGFFVGSLLLGISGMAAIKAIHRNYRKKIRFLHDEITRRDTNVAASAKGPAERQNLR